jgi:hypothetical protein
MPVTKEEKEAEKQRKAEEKGIADAKKAEEKEKKAADSAAKKEEADAKKKALAEEKGVKNAELAVEKERKAEEKAIADGKKAEEREKKAAEAAGNKQEADAKKQALAEEKEAKKAELAAEKERKTAEKAVSDAKTKEEKDARKALSDATRLEKAAALAEASHEMKVDQFLNQQRKQRYAIEEACAAAQAKTEHEEFNAHLMGLNDAQKKCKMEVAALRKIQKDKNEKVKQQERETARPDGEPSPALAKRIAEVTATANANPNKTYFLFTHTHVAKTKMADNAWVSRYTHKAYTTFTKDVKCADLHVELFDLPVHNDFQKGMHVDFLRECNMKKLTFDGAIWSQMARLPLGFLFECKALEAINMTTFKSLEIIDNHFCCSCSALKTADFSGLPELWCLMDAFMNGCVSLESINMSGGMKLSRVEQSFMARCSSLKEIDVSNWALDKAELPAGFLGRCSSLETIHGFDKLWRAAWIVGANFLVGTAIKKLDLSKMNRVRQVEAGCFSHMSQLTEVDLSPWGNVTKLGKGLLGGTACPTVAPAGNAGALIGQCRAKGTGGHVEDGVIFLDDE